MKILKFNESSLPKQVNRHEFYKKRDSHKFLLFTDKERQSMLDVLYKKREKKEIRWSLSDCFIEIYKPRIHSEIVKLDDEWFTVIDGSEHGSDTYYVCDTFDEVIAYLNQL